MSCPHCIDWQRKPKVFTVDEGLAIQTEDLDWWKAVLKPEVYQKLEELTKSRNHLAGCGHDIERGDGITQLLHRIGSQFQLP